MLRLLNERINALWVALKVRQCGGNLLHAVFVPSPVCLHKLQDEGTLYFIILISYLFLGILKSGSNNKNFKEW